MATDAYLRSDTKDRPSAGTHGGRPAAGRRFVYITVKPMPRASRQRKAGHRKASLPRATVHAARHWSQAEAKREDAR